MKKIINILFLLTFTSITISQWQTDVRLTNDPAISSTPYNNAWCIASSGDSVHVVWTDYRDGNWEIYYKRSTDGGVSWGGDTRLTNNSAESWYASISVSGSVVHVAWYDNRDGNNEIYYKRSTDGGVSWGGDTRLTNNSASSELPSTSVSGTTVHVVWHDNRDGNWEIYCKRSTDGGVSWGGDTRISNNAAESKYPSVSVSGSSVHVTWHDYRDGNYEVYYNRSTNGGVSWQADTRLTNNSDTSWFSSISVSGSSVHVVWHDYHDANPEIYYKRSTDGGVSWGTDIRLTNSAGNSVLPCIFVSGSVLHVTWSENRDGNGEIYYKRSTDGGSSWETDTRLTNDPATSYYSSISVSGPVVHVVWIDYRDGNQEIYYKRNPTGNIVGTQWQPDVRLTNDPAESETSNTTGWHIVTNGNVLHAVWSDTRNPASEIYYKRSTDGGVIWGADTRLTNNSGGSYSASIAVSGQVVHVAWCDNRDGNGDEIYYKRSTDGGINWGTDTRLTNAPSWSQGPCLSVTGSSVHVVWGDNRDGNYEIYYKRSIDGGLNWETDTRLTNNSFESHMPSIAVSDNVINILFGENRDGNYEIYYKRSTDVGTSWGADTRLTNNSGDSRYPCVTASGLDVHFVWFDSRDGNEEIYYKHSTDGGLNWGTDTRLTNYPGESRFPNLTLSGSNLHAVWQENHDGNYEIYYKRSTNSGVSWETDTRLTNASGNSWYPSVSISGLSVHVIWSDYRDGNYEIYYKSNPFGNPIGIKNISSEMPKSFSLSQNYPNPFNPTTNIRFDVQKTDFISIKIYDVLGREITTLVNEQLQPGTYEVDWDGSSFSSGVYFYVLSIDDVFYEPTGSKNRGSTPLRMCKKMILIK